MTEVKIPWPNWQITDYLGGGSFGKVYRIERKISGVTEYAAMKVIPVPREPEDAQAYLDRGYDLNSINETYKKDLDEIAREYSMMALLKGNANVVYCDDICTQPNPNGIGWTLYIRMELLTPLTKALTDPVSEAQVVKVGMDLCNALAACKKKNILHRDIKPANIMVAEDGNYKLGDFGVAKIAEGTASGTTTGTYNFMAPEVYNHQPQGPCVDIYSLGMVLYWMLNRGCGPFLPLPPTLPTAMELDEAKQRRFDGEQLPPPADGSQALKQIVLRACAFDPAVRYSTPEELYADLADYDASRRTTGGYTSNIPPAADKTDGRTWDSDNTWDDEYNKTHGSIYDSGAADGGTVGGTVGGDGSHLGILDIRGQLVLSGAELASGCVKLFTAGDGTQINVTVKPGTQAGDVLQLVGAGRQDAATGARGDAYITVMAAVDQGSSEDVWQEQAISGELTVSPEEAKKGGGKMFRLNDQPYMVKLPAGLKDMQVITVEARASGGRMETLTLRIRIEAPQAGKKKKKFGPGMLIWLLICIVMVCAMPPVGIGLLVLSVPFLFLNK